MDISGANVVITGGSQGIGAALADTFSDAGANVLVVARSEDKLKEVASRVDGQYLVADLGDSDDVDGLVAKCVDTLGSIDLWINNAGVETDEAFLDVSPAHVRALARLNFEAPLLLTQAVVKHMLTQGKGHVVQMSSIAGAISFPGLAAYCGSKAGLTNFTETLRLELADSPIGLTVVSPGPVDTPMWDRIEEEANYTQPALNRFRRMGFLPKIEPEMVAAKTLEAVREDKRFVRLPARFNGYHYLSNAPRRMVEIALAGVKLKSP